jgi:hypothetical protein
LTSTSSDDVKSVLHPVDGALVFEKPISRKPKHKAQFTGWKAFKHFGYHHRQEMKMSVMLSI